MRSWNSLVTLSVLLITTRGDDRSSSCIYTSQGQGLRCLGSNWQHWLERRIQDGSQEPGHLSGERKLLDLPVSSLSLERCQTVVLRKKFMEIMKNNLTRLRVSSCELEEVAEGALMALRGTLRALSFVNNQLTEIPLEIRYLSLLEMLDLSHNRIAVIPPIFEELHRLDTLRLDFNQLSEIVPTSHILASLRTFSASHNLIEVPMEGLHVALPKIFTLNLSHNKLEDAGNLSRVNSLANLDLSFNRLQHIDSDILPEQLLNVDLAGNPWHCNCSALWLIDWANFRSAGGHFVISLPTCETPLVFRGENLRDFSESGICQDHQDGLKIVDVSSRTSMQHTIPSKTLISASADKKRNATIVIKWEDKEEHRGLEALMWAIISVQVNGSIDVLQRLSNSTLKDRTDLDVYKHQVSDDTLFCLGIIEDNYLFYESSSCLPLTVVDDNKELVSVDTEDDPSMFSDVDLPPNGSFVYKHDGKEIFTENIAFTRIGNGVKTSWSVRTNFNNWSNSLQNVQFPSIGWKVTYRKFGVTHEDEVLLISRGTNLSDVTRNSYLVSGLDYGTSYLFCLASIPLETARSALQKESHALLERDSTQTTPFMPTEDSVTKLLLTTEDTTSTEHPGGGIPISMQFDQPQRPPTRSQSEGFPFPLNNGFVFTSSGQKISLPSSQREPFSPPKHFSSPGIFSAPFSPLDQVSFQGSPFQHLPFNAPSRSREPVEVKPKQRFIYEFTEKSPYRRKEGLPEVTKQNQENFPFLSSSFGVSRTREKRSSPRRKALPKDELSGPKFCQELTIEDNSHCFLFLIIAFLLSFVVSAVIFSILCCAIKNKHRKRFCCMKKTPSVSVVNQDIVSISDPILEKNTLKPNEDYKNEDKIICDGLPKGSGCQMNDSNDSCENFLRIKSDSSCSVNGPSLSTGIFADSTPNSFNSNERTNKNNKEQSSFHPGYDLPPSSGKKVAGYDYPPKSVPVNSINRERSHSLSSILNPSPCSSDSDYNIFVAPRLDSRQNLDSVDLCYKNTYGKNSPHVYMDELRVVTEERARCRAKLIDDINRILDKYDLINQENQNAKPKVYKEIVEITSEDTLKNAVGPLNVFVSGSREPDESSDDCMKMLSGSPSYVNLPPKPKTDKCLGDVVLTGGTFIEVPEGYATPRTREPIVVDNARVVACSENRSHPRFGY